jgi:hypothetical protein
VAVHNLHTVAAAVVGIVLPVYSSGFESSGDQSGWAGGSGVTLAFGNTPVHGGSNNANGQTTTGITATLTKTVTGLTVGVTYTVTAWCNSNGVAGLTAASVGISGIAQGSSVTRSAAWQQVSYTFTATATSHVVLLQWTTTTGAKTMFWDDVALFQSSYSLDVTSGTLTLDDTWSPYCQGSLVCTAPADSTIEVIDPRLTQRVSVTVTESFGTGTQWNPVAQSPVSRTFNLALRARAVSAVDQTLTLTVESDESLLQDFHNITASSERIYGLDVATAVAYALAQIGATLTAGYATATLTASLPTMANLPNLCQNPSAATNVTGFQAAVNNGAQTLSWQSAAGEDATGGFARSTITTAVTAVTHSMYIANESAVTPIAGHSYLMTGWFRTNAARTFYPCAYFGTGAGTQYGTPVAVAANTWTYFQITGVASPGATWAAMLVYTDAALPIGATMDLDNCTAQDVTAYEYANYHPNPSATAAIGTWVAGGANGTTTRQTGLTGSPVPSITTYVHTTWSGASGSGAGGIYFPSATGGIISAASQTWTYGAWFRSNINTSISLNMEENAGTNQTGATQQLVANVWTWLTQTFTTTAGTTLIGPYVYAAAGTQWQSGNTFDMLGMVLTPGSAVQPSFDGNFAADGLFTYGWQGAANTIGSASVKTYIPNVDAMIWLPGVAAWDWLTPMLQAGNLQLYCDEQRAWHLITSGSLVVAGVVSISSSTGLTDATDTIDLQDNSEYYTAVVLVYNAPSNTTTGLTPAPQYDVAGVAGPTLVITYDDTPYPGPGAAAAILARAAGKGRTFAVTAESQYGATPGQQLSITIPNGTIQSGSVSAVTWALPDGTMSVGSTGLLTIPSNAWIVATDTWATAPTGSWATDV